MDEKKWLRDVIEGFVPDWEDQSSEEIAEKLVKEIFDVDVDEALYLNWDRLMEMEAMWAEGADADYAIQVDPVPSEIIELLPLFLSRDDPSEFIEECYSECIDCNDPLFLGFHISPVIPFESIERSRFEEWINGEKQIVVSTECPNCGTVTSGKVPPAIPPETWLRWWGQLGIVLKDPILNKMEQSRRIEVLKVEENLEFDVADDDRPYHVPLVIDNGDGDKLAVDVVRSLGQPKDTVWDELHHFHTVCETNGIKEKLMIVVGGVPKGAQNTLVDLKVDYLEELFSGESSYRHLYLQTITYPEELDLIFNQMLYEYRIEGTPEGPSIYDVNNWERALMGINSDSKPGAYEELQIDKKRLETAKGPLVEMVARKHFEAQGYDVEKSDTLDEHKVDLLAQKTEGDTKRYQLVQCKAGSLSKEEVTALHTKFSEVQEKITPHHQLLDDNVTFQYSIVVGELHEDIQQMLREYDFEVKTVEEIGDNRDQFTPSERDILSLIKLFSNWKS